jgi:predicted RecA/RadA family phage recombinase
MTETTVVIVPSGVNSGSVRVDTSQITVKVINVNAAKHKVTFELPDKTTKTVKVGKKVDLSTVRPGDNVTVQVSEGFAITVEKNDSPVSNDRLTM